MNKNTSTLAGLKSRTKGGNTSKSFAETDKAKEQPLKPLTVRVTLDRHTKLKQVAAERHISMGELVAELIDTL